MPLPPWCEPWVPHLAPPLIRALGATWRVEVEGLEHTGLARDERGEDATADLRRLYAIWHGRMLALTPTIPLLLRRAPLVTMTSASRDGRIQARVLGALGVGHVTGSSSRRGARALVELARSVRDGSSAVLAVDGPTGPAFCAKSGIVALARMTGVPVVPVGAVCSDAWTIPNTWDAFRVPLPLSSIEVRFGRPIRTAGRSRDATADALGEVQRSLAHLNRTSPETLRVYDDHSAR